MCHVPPPISELDLPVASGTPGSGTSPDWHSSPTRHRREQAMDSKEQMAVGSRLQETGRQATSPSSMPRQQAEEAAAPWRAVRCSEPRR
ncbi:hypothetical protein NDU88_001263 [Pleurodeles waltl]|uniref:Uncharacterized protein n=1 Tax=Pleurodeles waltl TaxID=8319 RepID=A0AAV7NAD8_PLEWA|nr:hypothetical protein NDU88_001263 [Pleurodeles waltl]